MAETHADLIARLEAADKGSRELSWAIAEALGWRKDWYGVTLYYPPGVEPASPVDLAWDSGAGTEFPNYTVSLDDALTLGPEGANCWGIEYDPTGADAYWSRNRVQSGHWMVQAKHKSAPIALCIAALKARANGQRAGG